MKRNDSPTPEEQLDRLIEEHFMGATGELNPSSGFTASVMQAVQFESAEPEPIRFPWRRVIPGIAMVLLGLIALCLLAIVAPKSPASDFVLQLPYAAESSFWTVAISLTSVAAVFLATRWALRRG